MPKYKEFHEYIFKDGKHRGDYEKLYQDYDNPWEQSKELLSSDKVIMLNLMQKLNIKKVIEIGCGLGYFTNGIARLGIETSGTDISSTAIEKAKLNYPNINFYNKEFSDFQFLKSFNPDAIVLAETTWYILDKLDDFISFLKENLPSTYLFHSLTTYPPGVQKYGREKFTKLKEIMQYFNLNYYEWGEIGGIEEKDNCMRTYFVGRHGEL